MKVNYLMRNGYRSTAYVSETAPFKGTDKYTDQQVEVRYDDRLGGWVESIVPTTEEIREEKRSHDIERDEW